MLCEICKGKTKVVDCVYDDVSGNMLRIRKCIDCDTTYATVESLAKSEAYEVRSRIGYLRSLKRKRGKNNG